MTGQATWVTLAFLLVGAVFVYLLGWYAAHAGSAGPHRHYVTRVINCPRHGTAFDVTLVRDDAGNVWERVERCSAFRDPERVKCDQFCIDELNRGADLRVPASPIG